MNWLGLTRMKSGRPSKGQVPITHNPFTHWRRRQYELGMKRSQQIAVARLRLICCLKVGVVIPNTKAPISTTIGISKLAARYQI